MPEISQILQIVSTEKNPISKRRLQQLTDENVIVRVGRGEYDLKKSIHGYIDYLQSRIKNEIGENTNGNLKNRLLKAQTELKEKELAIVLKEYIDYKIIIELINPILNAAKVRITRMSKELAPQLVELEVFEIEQLINNYTNDLLFDLSKIPERIEKQNATTSTN